MITTLVNHLDNIITGMTFSYTFCDAKNALRDTVLTLGGVKDGGMKAFEERKTDIDYYMQCVWFSNDANGLSKGSLHV